MREELKDIEKRMGDAVLALKEKFKTLRTGRANLGLLDGLLVTAYGTEVPINQVANLSVPDPTLIVAAPWDAKMAAEIERAIRKSDLGLNPQSDGKIVRIPDTVSDRGAAQGPREEGAPHGGGGADRDPPFPPRGQRPPEEDVPGQADLGGRRAARAGREPEDHGPEDRRRRRGAEDQGEGDPRGLVSAGDLAVPRTP